MEAETKAKAGTSICCHPGAPPLHTSSISLGRQSTIPFQHGNSLVIGLREGLLLPRPKRRPPNPPRGRPAAERVRGRVRGAGRVKGQPRAQQQLLPAHPRGRAERGQQCGHASRLLLLRCRRGRSHIPPGPRRRLPPASSRHRARPAPHGPRLGVPSAAGRRRQPPPRASPGHCTRATDSSQSQPTRQPLRPSGPQSELKSARHCWGNTEFGPRHAADCRQLPHPKQTSALPREIRRENPSNRRPTSPALRTRSSGPSIQTPHKRQNLPTRRPPQAEPQKPAGISASSSGEARFGGPRAAERPARAPAAMARRRGAPARRGQTLGGGDGCGGRGGRASSLRSSCSEFTAAGIGGWVEGARCLVGSRFGLARVALGGFRFGVSCWRRVRACCGFNSGEKTGRAERDLASGGTRTGQGVCLLQLPRSKLFSNPK